MTERELKQCPFCGGDTIRTEYGDVAATVVCQKCNARTDYYPFVTEAVAAWNRRADTPVPVREPTSARATHQRS